MLQLQMEYHLEIVDIGPTATLNIIGTNIER